MEGASKDSVEEQEGTFKDHITIKIVEVLRNIIQEISNANIDPIISLVKETQFEQETNTHEITNRTPMEKKLRKMDQMMGQRGYGRRRRTRYNRRGNN